MIATEFRTRLLQLFYQDMHRLEQNNYSYRRFSYDGVDRSQQFDVGKHVMFMNWFQDTYEDVFKAWSRLTDEQSRSLYVDLIRYRLAGHLHVRINTAVHNLQAEAQACRLALNASPSQMALSGLFGQLVHYEGTWRGRDYVVDTIPDGMLPSLVFNQYYFNRAGLSIQPEPGDHVVDAGAFAGEVAVTFSKSVEATGRVYAFDPVESHLNICRLNFSRPGYENITLLPYAVGDRVVDAPAIKSSEYNPGYRASSSDVPVPTRPIDDLLEEGQIERVDFLKMDVEGSEMAALRGAERTIRQFRPKLAISIYHKPTDFSDIIHYVHDLNLGYSLFIDQHTIYEEETVLYAAVL